MCYAYGSIEQATGVCPMCKVFKPSGARCPHTKDVCHNRALHPRHDVVYIKNAEVQTFNGCGFCKLAKTNPPPKATGYQNPGWPGCCRPPSASEQRLVPPADWHAVSTVHHVPIPPDIRALLDKVALAQRTPSKSTPPLDRKNSGNTPTKSSTTSPNSKSGSGGSGGSGGATVKRERGSGSGGSPQLTSGSLSRASGESARSPTKASDVATSPKQRSANTHANLDVPPKRLDASPGRRSSELANTGSVARRDGSGRRPTITQASATAPASGPTPSMPNSPPRSAASAPAPPMPNSPPRSAASPQEKHSTSTLSRKSASPPSTRAGDAAGPPKLSVSLAALKAPPPAGRAHEPVPSSAASSGSSGSGSLTDGTVTSDGGFTDYLSDESEAELQRQAEARAALAAQNAAEEREFRQAREQLLALGLQPPRAWHQTRV